MINFYIGDCIGQFMIGLLHGFYFPTTIIFAVGGCFIGIGLLGGSLFFFISGLKFIWMRENSSRKSELRKMIIYAMIGSCFMAIAGISSVCMGFPSISQQPIYSLICAGVVSFGTFGMSFAHSLAIFFSEKRTVKAVECIVVKPRAETI